MSLGDQTWRTDALCYGSDPSLFFPDKGGAKDAKAVCRSCPVQIECLEFALVMGERFGVWGGCSERERQRIRRQRNARRRQT